MTTVIDTLVQTPLSILLGDVISLLKEKVDLVLNAKDDLELLQQKLRYFEMALKVIDHKPFFSNQHNRDLERELKDVIHDVRLSTWRNLAEDYIVNHGNKETVLVSLDSRSV